MMAVCGAHEYFFENISDFGLDELADGESDGMIMPTTIHRLSFPIFMGQVAEYLGPIDDSAPGIANDTYRVFLDMDDGLISDADLYGAYTDESLKFLLKGLDRINASCTMVFGSGWHTLSN
jgi:hypothetical protein